MKDVVIRTHFNEKTSNIKLQWFQINLQIRTVLCIKSSSTYTHEKRMSPSPSNEQIYLFK